MVFGCTLTTAIKFAGAKLNFSNEHTGLGNSTVSSIALEHWASESMETHLVKKGVSAAWDPNRMPQKSWAPSQDQVMLCHNSGCQPNDQFSTKTSDSRRTSRAA